MTSTPSPSSPEPDSAPSSAPSTAVVGAWALVEQAKQSIENLSPEQVEQERQADPDGSRTVIVDIRDHRELYLKGRVPGSVHAPRGMLEFWVDPAGEYHREVFDPSKRYILYCAGGGRSALAAKTMKDMGYADVAHLEPGFAGWEAAGLDVEDVSSTSKWIPRPS